MERKVNAGDEFIDQLLLKYRISLRAVADFAEAHTEDLRQAGNMFDLRTDRDKKLCLALFRLFSEDPAVRESFCGRYHIAGSSADDLFFEQHKLLLISAFIYNPSFFAMSCNLYGIIKSQLAFQTDVQEKGKEHQSGAAIKIISFQRTVIPYAASAADEILREIWSEDIKQDGISGKLRIVANNANDAGIVQFRFRFDEYRPEPPFYLRIQYETNSDHKVHGADLNSVAVNNSGKGELVIVSEAQSGIRYGGGFVITGLEIRQHG
jgi:hypothetical protein